MMEEALITRLAGVSAVADLVDDRISWFARVRGDGVPALSLGKISPGREWTHDGPSGLDRPRVQIDHWAATETEAVALARAVQAEMEVQADVAGTRFHPAMLDGEGWTDEGEQDGGAPLFRISRDYFFYHEQI